MGTSINIETGDWVDTTSTMNPPVDSSFEYLFEGFQFLGDRDDLRIYHTLITAFLRLRRQTVEINGRTWFTSADMDTGLTTSIGAVRARVVRRRHAGPVGLPARRARL